MLVFHRFTFNSFQVNTYLVFSENSKEGWLIDPGNSNDFEDKFLMDFINGNHVKISKVLNTHGHIDHILGLNFVVKNFTSEFYFPFPDLPLLKNVDKSEGSFRQAETVGIEIINVPNPKFNLTEYNSLNIGNEIVRIESTPGHSLGGTILIFENSKKVITGDTLFYESIGRTDLWNGDYDTLIKSIQEKILTLPDDYEILPGHGESSTVEHEKRYNSFLN